MKVAYYSPLPPSTSGIADYSALLVPALAERVDLRIARPRRPRPRGVDIHLYHVGNDPNAHGWIVDALRRRPGLVVLHDFVLHHLVAGLTLGRGDAEGYRSAMFKEAGVVGRLLAHGVIDGLVPPLWETRVERFPLTGEILGFANGLLVHSRFVADEVRQVGYRGPIWHVPHPAWEPPGQLPDPALPPDRFPVLGCFGHLTPAKRIPQLVAAFARVRAEFPEALLVLVGRPAAGFALAPVLEREGLTTDDVVQLDYVDEPRLWALIEAADVAVNLRWPTMGETSGTAIRALVAGTPLVVSDVGWFSELPDEAVEKIPVRPDEVDVLTETLLRLSRDRARRVEIAAAGRAFVRREHDLSAVADSYVEAIEEAAGRSALQDEVAREVARAAVDVGLGPSADEAGAVGRALSETGLGDRSG